MNTTLIFGAGISMKYGYPSGPELVVKIKSRLQSGDQDERLVARDLADHNPYSIDAFLKEFPRHDKIAKATIAEILYECEFPDFEVTQEDDFYRFLFHKIPKEQYPRFKIITFNYDRSFEFRMARHLRPSIGGMKNAFEALKTLEIIHIHGRLSSFPDEEAANPLGREREQLDYGGYRVVPPFTSSGAVLSNQLVHQEYLNFTDVYRDQMKKSIGHHGQSTFKTVYQNDSVNEQAKKAIQASDRVYFLGFSYHELNMKILGHNWVENLPRKSLIGTCYLMSPVERAETEKKYPKIHLKDCTAMGLFSKHYSLSDPSLNI